VAPNRDAIEAGLAFEGTTANAFGGELIPQSGGGWKLKLDVGSGSLLITCKSAPTQESIRVTLDWMREMVEACEGPNGTGAAPAFAFDFGSLPEPMIAFRFSDAQRLFAGELELPAAKQSKAQARRVAADISPLLRGEP
jgi:hypothetical protein